jgi:RNA polymerase sigma-70 factor (ECF subfamily)
MQATPRAVATPTPTPAPVWPPNRESVAPELHLVPAAPAREPEVDVSEETARTFDEFYASARPDIARALALALGDVDLALEATDEALARAYERWPLVRRLDRPEGWVYRVAMNWALSILRRRKRSDHKLYERTDTTLAVSDPDLHAALGELDVKHRTVIVCRHLLGWSVADTAAALRVREGTVKSRLSRATAILHARLHHLRDSEEHS